VISIIDYGSGNLRSIQRALESHNLQTTISGEVPVIQSADAVVLPGVGHAGHAMEQLHKLGMAEVIHRTVDSGKPFLGICVGMQVLFGQQGEGGAEGLGVLEGRVRKIEDSEKVPHIGWNVPHSGKAPPTALVNRDPYYYFVHSFVAQPANQEDIAAVTTYGERFPSAVIRENVWGTQFHPEKSGEDGLAFLGLWAKCVRDYTGDVDQQAS
jgi:imidazole glycerol-phosphate synthase subunit HisH